MPKTIRNQFDKKLTIESLTEAHKLSSKNKRYKKEVILFNLKEEEYIEYLYGELKDGTYTHGGYKTFYITEPKPRKIQASCYIDRIVHRWVVDNFLKEYFIKGFISTSYACIEGRGTHKAVKDVQSTMKHLKRIWGDYYILKMDIAHYFQNINKEILTEILGRKIKDKKLMDLLHKIIYSNKDCTGIPIGNYTSQIFANIYLNELDMYIKNNLKCKYYFRYMDDTVVFCKTKDEAREILKSVKHFLESYLKLDLNKKTQVFKSKQGLNFCGYKINEYRLKIRDRGKKSLKRKVKFIKGHIKSGDMTAKEGYKYLAGHAGYIKIADTKNLEDKLFFST